MVLGKADPSPFPVRLAEERCQPASEQETTARDGERRRTDGDEIGGLANEEFNAGRRDHAASQNEDFDCARHFSG